MPRCDCCSQETTAPLVSVDSMELCPSCFASETAVCDHCGARILIRDAIMDDSMTLCDACYTNSYTNCAECGRIIESCDAIYGRNGLPYCERCYDSYRQELIHPYHYKPDPIFYGEGSRFFGVELEVDEGGEEDDSAEELLQITGDQMYIKHDGSLDEGFEMVTHPMTLDYHCHHFPWKEVTQKAVSLGYLSHKTDTCGLHIHVNRTSLGDTEEQQESTIARILYFVEEHWNELVRFSRRTYYQLDRWASRYGRKDSPKELLSDIKKEGYGRYACVNLKNYATIEFRIFRGTLRYQTIIAALQLVDEICRAAISMSDEQMQNLSWSDFVSVLDKSACSELIEYLKMRRLYVNEPQNSEEDV